MKDWNDKDPHMVGYCPLGEGKVDLLGILDVIEKKEKKTRLKGRSWWSWTTTSEKT